MDTAVTNVHTAISVITADTSNMDIVIRESDMGDVTNVLGTTGMRHTDMMILHNP